jgi:DNA-binding transcriptional LysR family regulator
VSELDEMRAFVEVVESGGFGRAAERLGLSKSIVSRRVSALEAGLGARLLDRTTRGVAPTPAGEEFKARAERILAELEEARDVVAESGRAVVGLLRVSAPLSFGLRNVAPLLAEMALRYPKLRIEASYSDRAVDLIAERFDAAIRIGMLRDSTLVARRIAAVHAVIVASPAYLERHGTPRTPADLAGREFLLRNGAVGGEALRFRSGRRWISVRAEGRFRADNGEALLAAALAGVGLAPMPTFLVAPAIESGALVPLLVDYAMPEAGLYLVRPPGAHVPAKVRALTDLLLERFGGEPWWDACMMHRRAADRLSARPGESPREGDEAGHVDLLGARGG